MGYYSIRTPKGEKIHFLVEVRRKNLSRYDYQYHLKNEYYNSVLSKKTIPGVSKEDDNLN